MFGLTTRLHPGTREHTRLGLIGFSVAAILALLAWAPSAAHAVTCENSWTNTAGGSWSEPNNWSKKAVPASGEEVCITEPGTYTVTLTTNTTTTVKSLTIGGSSGTQTLAVGNVSNANSALDATSAAGVNAHGAITLTDGSGQNGESVTLESGGTITNAGTITAEQASGGARFLKGNIVNTGTLQINTGASFNASKTTLTNEGALNVANEKTLTVAGESSVVNGKGGKIAAAGSGDVFLEPKTSFTQGAGTTSGTLPVVIESGSLKYTGSGSSTIAQRNTGGALSGTSSTGQALLIENNTNQNAAVTATSFTNGGTITLTDAPTDNGENVTLASSGTLTNTGTITAEADAGGTRFLQGDFVNKGTVDIDAPTDFNGLDGALTNEGTLNVGETFQLVVSGEGSVTNTSGNIAGGSGEHPGDVFMEAKTSFTQGEGTTSGTLPVIIESGTLKYTGTGSSTIAQRGTEGTLSGSLASGQTLLIENNTNQNAAVTASASFTNAGKITLTDAPGDNGESVTLALTAGTLTNTGTITTVEDAGGARFLQGSLTNKGTLAINTNTAYNASKATLTNEGMLNVATGKTLTVSNEGSVTNGTGGKIEGGTSGQVFLDANSAFTEGAGTTTGTLPVVIESGSLKYTGSGSSTIAQRNTGGTLTGAPAAKQTLSIQNNTNQNAAVTAATSFTNSGTIILTDAPNANGENVSLVVAGGTGTLTNKGTITVEADAGGGRTIEAASLKNEKTLSLGAGVDLKVTGAYTQTSKGTLKTAIGSSSSYGALSVTSTATIAGNLAVTVANKFKSSLGQNYNILTSSALTGTFVKETGGGAGNSNGLYYKPTYSATGVTLVVSQATLVLSVTSGAPGTVVKLSGKGYLPEDTITPSFTDKAKVKTIFTAAAVKTNSSGEFSTEITIPAGAAVGAGKITVASANTGLSFGKTFTVT
jgi:hypothetical protein